MSMTEEGNHNPLRYFFATHFYRWPMAPKTRKRRNEHLSILAKWLGTNSIRKARAFAKDAFAHYEAEWRECERRSDDHATQVKSAHDYEAAHGTQEAQAKAQATRGTVEADGPWRLERWTVRDDLPVRAVLDNSVRSTRGEAERLRDQVEDANDIRWSVVRCEG